MATIDKLFPKKIGFAAGVFGAVFLTACYLFATLRAGSTHLWLDEVNTVWLARLPSYSAIWDAIWAGADYSPPTYLFLLHPLLEIGGESSRLLPRIPSIVAVFGAAICIYFLMRPSMSRSASLVAFGGVLGSGIFEFAVQARQYALIAFALALALVVWDRLEEARRKFLYPLVLWAALSLAVSLHFFGVVIPLTLGVCEFLWLVTRRRFRLTAWIPIAGSGLTAAAWLPLASHLSKFNAIDAAAENFYAKPTPGRFADGIFDLLIGGTIGALVMLVAVGLIISANMINRMPLVSQDQSLRVPSVEDRILSHVEIVIIALCALPLITFGLSLFVTKAFSLRYMSSVALLFGLGLGYVVNRVPFRNLVATILVVLLAGQIIYRGKKPDPVQDVLGALGRVTTDLPIVVGEGLLFIELMRAADEKLRSSLVYLASPPDAETPDPTNELMVVRHTRWRPDYRVVERERFIAENPSFVLVTRSNFSTDIITPWLLDRGLIRDLRARKDGVLIFVGGDGPLREGRLER